MTQQSRRLQRQVPSRTAAAIDVGSNSVHLLVARARRAVRLGTRTDLIALADDSDLIGLGDSVDTSGRIELGPRRLVVAALARQVALARSMGAERVVMVGTEPLRRASNTRELVLEVRRRLGEELRVIDVRSEAELTFMGVCGGRMPDDALAVVDIGGGSTEVSVHVPGRELQVIPLTLGSARLTNAIVRHDPPTTDEIAALMKAAVESVHDAEWPIGEGPPIRRAIFVGGTATNVARLGRLDRAHLNEDLNTIGQMPSATVVEHFGVRPRRARQLAAGVAIVSALLDRFLLGSADVSEASLRDGAIIAVLATADDWLNALDEMTD